MKLSDRAIKAASPKDKPYKVSDGHGMYLEVRPNGGKWWRLKYRHLGKEKRISLGTYPDVSLKDARERRENARKLISDGVDPSAANKAQKLKSFLQNSNTFETVAREWHAGQARGKWAEARAKKVMQGLENDLIPFIGTAPIDSITAPELLAVLRRKEAIGAVYSAHRLHQIADQIFRYAVATGRTDRNPAPDLRGALQTTKVNHRAALTDPDAVGGLLRAIDGYEGSLVVKSALRLAPLVFVRPGELRHAEWSEIDLTGGLWNIPSEKMKMREPHLVPLSNQAVDILSDLQKLTGRGRYAFPSARTISRPMSDVAILAALRRMGYEKSEMTGHGFRAIARTLLDEVLGIRPDWIEHQLAHTVRDPNGRAYNRTAHLKGRKEMMQMWADYLDHLKNIDTNH